MTDPLVQALLGSPDAASADPSAAMRLGTVTQVSPLLVQVGAATTARPCSTVSSYFPVLNDYVVVLVQGADRIVIASALATPGSIRGALGRVTNGSGFDTPTSGTTVLTAGATASTAMYAGRKYMARLELNDGWYGTIGADQFTITIQEDGTGLPGGGVPVYIAVAGQYIAPGSLAEPFTTTTGNHVYRAAAVRSTGTGSLQFRGQLYIYDDGPV